MQLVFVKYGALEGVLKLCEDVLVSFQEGVSP